MSKTAQEKLAEGVMQLKRENERLQKEAEALREHQELFEKRARAEEILLEAREKPSTLRTATIDDFLAKRAQLEDQNEEQLEKIASAVEYLDESDGIMIDDYEDDNPRQDFTEWLREQSSMI